MHYKPFLICFFFLIPFCALAQKSEIKGKIIDSLDKGPLTNATVIVLNQRDSSLITSARADNEGRFSVKKLNKGIYRMIVTFPDMADYIKIFEVHAASVLDLQDIKMIKRSILLAEVEIRAEKIRAMAQLGDTTEYHAGSYMNDESANVEELLKRLPGFTVDSRGNIQVKGKQVVKVLVDGDEFLGDDPVLATRYLKAKSIEKVQVYDDKSNKSKLTGIEDGVKKTTINLKLKPDAKKGALGDLNISSNLSNFHSLNLMAGIFNDNQKYAIASSYSTVDKGSSRAIDRFKSGDDFDLIDDNNNAFTSKRKNISELAGIPKNFSTVGYYSNKWNEGKTKFKVNFEQAENSIDNAAAENSKQILPDNYVLKSNSAAILYNKINRQKIYSVVNLKLDSLSSLNIALGGERNVIIEQSNSDGQTLDGDNLLTSEIKNDFSQREKILESFGNINFSKKFLKPGRSLYANFQPFISEGNGDRSNYGLTKYIDTNGQQYDSELLDIKRDFKNTYISLGADVGYTEPLSKVLSFSLYYGLKSSNATLDQKSFDASKGMALIDSLGDQFKSRIYSNIGTVKLAYRIGKSSITAGLRGVNSLLENETEANGSGYSRSFFNLSPSLLFVSRPKESLAVNFSYNGTTGLPSIDQLRPVTIIYSSLFKIVGNPTLRPYFSNQYALGFEKVNAKKESILMINLRYSDIKNAIANVQSINNQNMQVLTYINTDGNKSFNITGIYIRNLSKIHINYNGLISYTKDTYVGFLNTQVNNIRASSWSFGNNFTYDLSTKITFTYNQSYLKNIRASSLGDLYSGVNYTHYHKFGLTVRLPYDFVYSSSANYTYQPANAIYRDKLSILSWNAGLSTKILKDKSLRIRMDVFDILNQNRGYQRVFDSRLISERTFSVVGRYFTLGLNWTFSENFKKKE